MTWTYGWARKFSASRFEIVMRVYFSEFWLKEFGVRLDNTLIKPADGNHAIYFIQDEWDSFSDRVYQHSCKSLERFKLYVQLIEQTQIKSLNETQAVVKQPLRKLSWERLCELWQRWDTAHIDHFIKPIMIPFVIEPLLAKDAETICRKHNIPLESIFSPDQPNAIVAERVSLLRIALGQSKKSIADHAAEFGFIPCYDVIDEPWNEEHFRKDLQKLIRRPTKELKEQLKELTSQFDKCKVEFEKTIAASQLSEREKELLTMAHQLVYIKDERDDYRRRQSYAIQPLFGEIARRYDLPFRAPLYLINREMHQWFETGKLPVARRELKQRMKGYCLARINSQPTEIYSGENMIKFLATQKFADQQTISASQMIKGMVGNKGIIQGRAVIIITKHDLRKVQHGDVLIAVTTNPDYVPAMRRSRAFVTDEGGITSHAAIVAREMDKPCLVGTKFATKTFHDGDLVEVDATQGVVKRLTNG